MARHRSDLRPRALLCAFIALGTTLPVRADPSDRTPKSTDEAAKNPEYERAVLQALSAYDAGRWDEARRLFERAHGIDPTARTLRTIGMAAFNQGDYVAALQNLEAALVDPRKPLTVEQRSHVTQLIERANQEVGRFRVRMEPPHARLLVDGKSPSLSREGELVLLPGRHELVASADGYGSASSRLDVQARDRSAVQLHLQAMASLARASETGVPRGPEPASPPGPAARPDDAGAARSSVWAVVALGVGGAGLIAAGVTGGLAIAQKNDLDKACDARRCGPSAHDRVDRYDALRTASGIALAIGIVGAGIGTYLVLDGAEDEGSPRLRARIGPGVVAIDGRL